MTARTIAVLEQMGNVSHDDYARAYHKAIINRVSNLTELQKIETSPWYDRLFNFWHRRALIRDINQEQEFLTHCHNSVSWPLVKDEIAAKLCTKFERLEDKLFSSPWIRKSLKLDE